MPPRYRLLVADDDQALRAALERALRFEGYAVALAADGDEVISQVRAHPPDLVVLDLAMPGTGGVEACRRLRAEGNHVPVLMLTARDGVSARVAGLDAGADDYLVKPFALQELLARLRALLRRIASQPDEQGRVMRLADLTLDGAARRVTRGGQPVELTRTEFDLLETLLAHAGQVLTRGQLFERVWGCDLDGTSNTLDVYIGYLRRKLEAGGAARLLHTVRGVGFVLREDAT